MANTPVRDAAGNTVYLSSTGTGSLADPYVSQQVVAGTITATLGTSALTIGAVLSPLVTVDSTFTGIGTVTGAGTPVQGGSITNANGFVIKAHPSNAGTIWVFDWGGTKARGFPLTSAVPTMIFPVGNLNMLGFDTETNGEKFCWIKA